ncbi:hypothetical protein SDC9_33258 [bioreactor metagenome]|uniref:Uncharacterized protein n=1 Tax=bioreactor metagenome TaxID=1076179 RepID=A0A644V7E8_9ZZZZ|nr:hypothetical protein [Candidatus Elulimicrobiales bacterium]
MSENILKVIGSICATAAVIFAIFYFMGGSNLLEPLVYTVRNTMGGGLSGAGRFIPAIIVFAIFFMPVILTKVIIDGKKEKEGGKDDKK